MANVQHGFAKGKSIFVGIDVHKRDWTVHVVCQGEELYHSTISPEPERLIAALRPSSSLRRCVLPSER
jgi:hypothetical protein